MQGLKIRRATHGDEQVVTAMLGRLADDLGYGHVFASTPESVRQHGLGDGALFSAFLAEQGGIACGLAVSFPHYSTFRGRPGVFVLDLWVSPEQRGRKTGEALLAAVAAAAAKGWGASYLMLSVHAENAGARRFYHRLGFDEAAGDLAMALDNAAFSTLAGAGDAT